MGVCNDFGRRCWDDHLSDGTVCEEVDDGVLGAVAAALGEGSML